MRIPIALAAWLGAAALSATGCSIDAQSFSAEGTFSRTLTAGGPVTLEVQTGSGDIQIKTGEAGSVQVRGTVRAGWGAWTGTSAEERVRQVEADPPIEQSANVIRLGRRQGLDGVSISYEITVPPETRVRARTGSGDQIVGDLQGTVVLESGSGDIRVGRTEGDVRASTGSGDVLVESATGGVEVHTGSGSVSTRQTAGGRTEITTGSGDVTVAGAGGPLRLRAGSGDLFVDGAPSASWDIGTGSGDIIVQIPRSAAFDLEAHSSSGRIESDHQIAVIGSVSRRDLRGQVRGGGPRLDVSTSSGDIRIR